MQSLLHDCFNFVFIQNENFSNPLNIPFPLLREDTNPSNGSGAGEDQAKSKRKEKEQRKAEPRYTVTHRGDFSMQDFTNERHSTVVRRPKELVVRVEVPGVKSAASMDVEIFEKRVLLECKSPRYHLDVSFELLLCRSFSNG